MTSVQQIPRHRPPIAITADTVRALLPDCKVLTPDGVRVGVVRGRFLKFAQVTVCDADGFITSLSPCIEVAWETLAHCINNDVPVRA